MSWSAESSTTFAGTCSAQNIRRSSSSSNCEVWWREREAEELDDMAGSLEEKNWNGFNDFREPIARPSGFLTDARIFQRVAGTVAGDDVAGDVAGLSSSASEDFRYACISCWVGET